MSLEKSYEHFEAYTPADNTQAPVHDAIYIAAAGDIAVRTAKDATPVVFTVVDGSLLKIKAWSIDNTNTDATSVVLLRDTKA